MAMTPAQRHRQRALAEQAAAAAPAGSEPTGGAYELMLSQLIEHRRRLKDIQSVERKIDAKRQFLAEYDAWIDAVLSQGQGAADLVLTTVMVWHIDAGNYARALQIARYVVQHHLDLPDQYERNTATLLIDEFAAAALAGKLVGAEALAVLPAVQELTADLDAPDQARAKLHKAIGYALIGKLTSSDIDFAALPTDVAETALPLLRRAHQLFDQVGVKKDIERLERRLRKPEPAGL